MMKKFFLLLLLVPALDLNAQSGFQKLFADTFNFNITSFIKCSDGNLLISANYYEVPDSGSIGLVYQPAIMKLSASGIPLWSKTISFPNASATDTYSIDATGENGTSGYYALVRSYSATSGGVNFHLVFLDLNGTATGESVLSFAITQWQYATPQITRTETGEFFLMPSIYSSSYLFKLDASGNLLWGKSVSADTLKNPGMTVIPGINGTAMLGCKSDSDPFLVHVGENGSILWTRRYHFGDTYLRIYDGVQRNNGDFLFCGLLQDIGNWGYSNAGFLMCVDSSGNFQWLKKYTGMFNDFYFLQMCLLPNQELVMAGTVGTYYTTHTVFIKTDSNGNVVLSKILASSNLWDYYYDEISLSAIDGNIYYAGARNFFQSDASLDFCNLYDFYVYAPGSLTNPVVTDDEFTQANAGVQAFGAATTSDISFSVDDYCLHIDVAENFSPENSISVYPNPVSKNDKIYLTANGVSEEIFVSITDAQGRLIYSATCEKTERNQTIELAGSKFHAGIYFVQVFSGRNGRRIGTAKVAVQ